MRRRRNWPARFALLAAVLAAAAVPCGVALSRYDERVTLVYGIAGGAAAGALLAGAALLLARRGRARVQRTLGRSGGERTAAAARLIGVLGLCAAVSAGLSLGFYGLLVLFA